MERQIRQYHCPECNKIVDPIVKGRAIFECDQCGKDITLEVVLQYEAMMKDSLLSKTKDD